jgi:hypothetical protein
MWQSILISVVAIVVALFEIPRLKKLKYTKEIWFFSFFLLLATVANILKFLYF